MALLGQFVSIMSGFFTNAGKIESHGYQKNFYDKFNMMM